MGKKFSIILKIANNACLYSCPLYLPVTGENVGNMNWAVAIVGAEVLWSSAYWVYAARHKYMKETSGLALIEGSVQVLDGQMVEHEKQADGVHNKAKATDSGAIEQM